MIPAYPLQWPPGWRRTLAHHRRDARFSKSERVYSTTLGVPSYLKARDLTLADAVARVLKELARFGVVDRGDVVISTNVPLKLNGLPRSGERDPDDPGVAVYWQDVALKAPRVMAIDVYSTVAGNLGAVAATLEAMRAIERHGGAMILERAFTGFVALPAPSVTPHWSEVLDVDPGASPDAIRAAYRKAASTAHPDRNSGSHEMMTRLNQARDRALEERT